MGGRNRMGNALVHCTAVRVDQVIPSLASRDAIGVSTLNLRDGLRAVGIDSDVFYGNSTPDVAHEGRPVIELGRAGRDRWLLYQASIGSPVYDILAARAEPKLVNYHNITPAALLRDWEPAVAYEAALGRTQLARLAPQSRLAVADSAFNESELQALGYEGTAVVPLLIDMHVKSDEPDPELAAALARRKEREGGADLLYVGKISPHKAPHDLVKMLDVLRRVDDPAARLHLVGSPLGETYEPALRAFIDELGLSAAVNLAGVGQRRGARGVLPCGRRLRDGVGPRGLLRPPGRGHGPRRPDRRLRRHRGARDRGWRGAGAGRQVAGAVRGRRGAGARRTRCCVRCWCGRAGSGRRASTWARRPGASSRSSSRPSAPPDVTKGQRPGGRTGPFLPDRSPVGGAFRAGRARCQPRSSATRSTARSPAEGRSRASTRRRAATAELLLERRLAQHAGHGARPARRGRRRRPAARRRRRPRAARRPGWPRPAGRASSPRSPAPRSPRGWTSARGRRSRPRRAASSASLSAPLEGHGVVEAHLVDEAVEGLGVGRHDRTPHHLERRRRIVLLPGDQQRHHRVLDRLVRGEAPDADPAGAACAARPKVRRPRCRRPRPWARWRRVARRRSRRSPRRAAPPR